MVFWGRGTKPKENKRKSLKAFCSMLYHQSNDFDSCLSSWLCPCSNKASSILSAGCCLCPDQECPTHNTLIPANWAARQAGRHKQPPVGQKEHRPPKRDQAYSSLNCIRENLVLLAQNFNAHYVPGHAGERFIWICMTAKRLWKFLGLQTTQAAWKTSFWHFFAK